MLVPDMTPAELKRELMKDEPWLHRKTDVLWIKLRRMAIKSRQKELTVIVETVSPRKNKWLIKFVFNKKTYVYNLVAYFYDHIGIRAFGYAMDPKTKTPLIIVYNTHFIKRYNERLKLNISNPLQLLKHLVTNAPECFNFEHGETLDDLFCVMAAGIGLGCLHEKGTMLEMKTFITFDMLYDKQVKLTEHLRSEILFQLEEIKNSPPKLKIA